MTTDLDEMDGATEQGLALIGEAEGMKITSQPAFARAGELRQRCKALIEGIKEHFRPMKQAQDAAKKVILDNEKRMLDGPVEALRIVNEGMVKYERDQYREKMLAEARAAEEAARLEAARPAPTPGQIPLPPIVVPARRVEMPKAEGVSFSTHWKSGQVQDMMELARSVASGKVTPLVLIGNQKVLDDLAREQKENFSIPGVGHRDLTTGKWISAVPERRARG